MALLSSFNEDRPVTYFRGHPIYCATILTVAYGIGVLATFLAKAFGGWEAIVSLLAFDSGSFDFRRTDLADFHLLLRRRPELLYALSVCSFFMSLRSRSKSISAKHVS